MTRKKRTGIIGGTFDPIHIGHLIAADRAREHFNLDRILFIPAGDPPHKDTSGMTSAEDRYVMVLLATLDHPDFSVSRLEIDREGKSFTLHTLQALKKQFGEEEQLYFIMGADSLAEIQTWHRPDDILSLCELIVATRPNWDLRRIAEDLGSFYVRLKHRIHQLAIPDLAIASREIRQRIAAGTSIRYMVPDLVDRYIQQHRLYVPGDETEQGKSETSAVQRDDVVETSSAIDP